MTVRRRIRSLAGSTAPTPSRGGPPSPAPGRLATRAVGAISPPRADRLAQSEPPATRTAGDTFEWEMRNSDGPTDSALYLCACGYQFTARVATTVSCPNCGGGQAW
ncbi:MAG TPA: hypothetical protein VG165_18170 [Solirubrobacteraceae bacterium]|jgi:hypothetical protein|nr:hypothetical protein [Solirubrobacteraceae bacterium]